MRARRGQCATRSRMEWTCTAPDDRVCGTATGMIVFFFFQAEDGIRDLTVTGVQTCALPIYPEHRSPLMWEVMTPSPPPTADEKRRIQRATQSANLFNWLAPTFRYVHAVGAELPQECISLMTPTFMSDQFDTMYYVPSYRAWFFQQDLGPAYEYHRRFLQHLQFRRAARRWVLKAPTHMSAMPALLSVYPDALFVQAHRTPLEAMASVSSLITILRRVFSDSVDPFVVCSDATQYWSETLDAFLPERDRLPPERICDVDYFEIRRDPIAVARRIYQHFGWLLSEKA